MVNILSLNILIKGCLVGFAMAAPIGPIALLCIRRTLAQGMLMGFLCGLGAASADVVYGLIASFSLTFLNDFVIHNRMIIAVCGALFLTYFGLKIFFSRAVNMSSQASATNIFGAYFSTFFLTLSNPMTLLAFTAIFAGLKMSVLTSNWASTALFLTGIFLGALSWWFLLSMIVGLLRFKCGTQLLYWINKISGIIIIIFALSILIHIWRT